MYSHSALCFSLPSQYNNNIDVSRLKIYDNLGRNPGIIYWQIRQPVTINMCTSYWINQSCCLAWSVRIKYIFSLQLLILLAFTDEYKKCCNNEIVDWWMYSKNVACSNVTWKLWFEKDIEEVTCQLLGPEWPEGCSSHDPLLCRKGGGGGRGGIWEEALLPLNTTERGRHRHWLIIYIADSSHE